MGCIEENGQDITPITEQGDIEILSFEMLNSSSIFLGDSFNVKSEVISTSQNATYVVSIKLGKETVYVQDFKGNQTIEAKIYAPLNGKHNLTILAYPKSLSDFVDLDLDNNEFSIPLHIHSYGKYNFSSSKTEHIVISNERVLSTKLHFENPVYVNSIGTFLRVTAPLNIDSYVFYEIVNDDNGFPGNESLFNLTVQLYKISPRWDFLLLQKKDLKLESGTYWLNFYVEEKNFIEIACATVSNSTNVYSGSKFHEDISWKKGECEPYFIVSSAQLIETYEDFSNRFSIFDVTESNSS